MKLFKVCYYIFLLVLVVVSLIVYSTPFTQIMLLPDNIELRQDDIDPLIKSQSDGVISSIFNRQTNTIDYYLCGAIKFKSVNAEIMPEKTVLLGGDVIGMEYNTQGIFVVGKNKLMGKEGFYDNLSNNELINGDVITEINGIEVNNATDVSKILNSNEFNGEMVDVKAIRKGKEYNTRIKPAYDLLTKKYKLGLWVKTKINGIGTLTYIDKESHRFGSLGHGISESGSNILLDVLDGEVYGCCVLGIKQATRGAAGELRGMLKTNKVLGTVEKNVSSGLYGEIKDSSMLESRKEIAVGGKHTVVPGKALIYCSIDGRNVRAYDIEIIKTATNSASNKNMIIKVVDKRLLAATGGIVQGMSGSPIVQNGKLVGAVTHVFVNDSTKGFGIFIDNMIQN